MDRVLLWNGDQESCGGGWSGGADLFAARRRRSATRRYLLGRRRNRFVRWPAFTSDACVVRRWHAESDHDTRREEGRSESSSGSTSSWGNPALRGEYRQQ